MLGLGLGFKQSALVFLPACLALPWLGAGALASRVKFTGALVLGIAAVVAAIAAYVWTTSDLVAARAMIFDFNSRVAALSPHHPFSQYRIEGMLLTGRVPLAALVVVAVAFLSRRKRLSADTRRRVVLMTVQASAGLGALLLNDDRVGTYGWLAWCPVAMALAALCDDPGIAPLVRAGLATGMACLGLLTAYGFKSSVIISSYLSLQEQGRAARSIRTLNGGALRPVVSSHPALPLLAGLETTFATGLPHPLRTVTGLRGLPEAVRREKVRSVVFTNLGGGGSPFGSIDPDVIADLKGRLPIRRVERFPRGVWVETWTRRVDEEETTPSRRFDSPVSRGGRAWIQ